MAWSETMYTIQHFYNSLNLNERMEKVEKSFPFIAERGSGGEPEGVNKEDLLPGTIWFIKENK